MNAQAQNNQNKKYQQNQTDSLKLSILKREKTNSYNQKRFSYSLQIKIIYAGLSGCYLG